MYISQRFTAESAEPWLQLMSAVIVLGTALWMFWRTWKGEQNWLTESQENEHHHQDETKRIDTGHGMVELSIF
ncbi:Nickel/cobalt efflux system rcnA [Cedecea neteri]|nr:Nickel/cobalt efflux system rcnA [Cedecea neteri]